MTRMQTYFRQTIASRSLRCRINDRPLQICGRAALLLAVSGLLCSCGKTSDSGINAYGPLVETIGRSDLIIAVDDSLFRLRQKDVPGEWVSSLIQRGVKRIDSVSPNSAFLVVADVQNVHAILALDSGTRATFAKDLDGEEAAIGKADYTRYFVSSKQRFGERKAAYPEFSWAPDNSAICFRHGADVVVHDVSSGGNLFKYPGRRKAYDALGGGEKGEARYAAWGCRWSNSGDLYFRRFEGDFPAFWPRPSADSDAFFRVRRNAKGTYESGTASKIECEEVASEYACGSDRALVRSGSKGVNARWGAVGKVCGQLPLPLSGRKGFIGVCLPEDEPSNSKSAMWLVLWDQEAKLDSPGPKPMAFFKIEVEGEGGTRENHPFRKTELRSRAEPNVIAVARQSMGGQGAIGKN